MRFVGTNCSSSKWLQLIDQLPAATQAHRIVFNTLQRVSRGNARSISSSARGLHRRRHPWSSSTGNESFVSAASPNPSLPLDSMVTLHWSLAWTLLQGEADSYFKQMRYHQPSARSVLPTRQSTLFAEQLADLHLELPWSLTNLWVAPLITLISLTDCLRMQDLLLTRSPRSCCGIWGFESRSALINNHLQTSAYPQARTLARVLTLQPHQREEEVSTCKTITRDQRLLTLKQ